MIFTNHYKNYKGYIVDINILKQFNIDCLYSSSENDLRYFVRLIKDGINPNVFLIRTLLDSKKSMIRLSKFDEKPLNTAKYIKKREELNIQCCSAINDMLRNLTDSHHFQIQFFKLVWVAIKVEGGETIHNAPKTYPELLNAISEYENTFFPEEIECLRVFNGIRNSLMHTPTQVLMETFSYEVFDHTVELVKLMDKANTAIGKLYNDEILEIINKEVIKINENVEINRVA